MYYRFRINSIDCKEESVMKKRIHEQALCIAEKAADFIKKTETNAERQKNLIRSKRNQVETDISSVKKSIQNTKR